MYPFLTNGSKPHKLHFKIFKEIRNAFNSRECSNFGFQKKKGKILEVLDWDLNFSALRHLKNLC